MKLLFRILGVLLFLTFFFFALKNTEEVALRFFLGHVWRAPLVLLLLGFFAGGAVLGVVAMMPTVLRQRRELGRNRKAAVALRAENSAHALARMQPPQPDSF